MRGIKYYPEENKEELLNKLFNKIEVRFYKDDKNLPFSERWDYMKGLAIGDKNFIINRNMHEACKNDVEEIVNNKVTLEDVKYDFFKLYDYMSDIVHMGGKYYSAKDIVDEKSLILFVDKLVMQGVNIDELKNYIFSGLLLNMDSFYDGTPIGRELMESKVKFSVRMVDLIDMYDQFSPYEFIFRKFKMAYEDPSITNEYLNNILNKYDDDMVKHVVNDRMMSNILNTIYSERYDLDDREIHYSIMSQFYERRPDYRDTDEKNKGIFKYQISDSGKYKIADLFSASLEDKDALMEQMYDEGFISDKEYLNHNVCMMISEFLKEREQETITEL